MAQTVNDFILEYDNYEYSGEAYELMKECSELNLMAMYLDNQQFISDYSESFDMHTEGFDGYFQESADQTIINSVEQQFYEKANGIKSNIVNGIKKILTTIRNFIVKIINKFDDSTRTVSSVRKRLEKAKNIDIERLVENLDKLATGCNIKFDSKQPSAKGLKVVGDFKSIDKFYLLAAALSTDYVYVNNDNKGAVEFKRLPKLLKQVNNDKVAVSAANNELSECMKQDVFEIDVNEKKLKKVYEDLESLSNTIVSTKDSNARLINEGEPEDEDKKVEVAKATIMNTFYSNLNKAISNTMRLYTSFIKYRHNATTMISAVISNSEINHDGRGFIDNDESGGKRLSKKDDPKGISRDYDDDDDDDDDEGRLIGGKEGPKGIPQKDVIYGYDKSSTRKRVNEEIVNQAKKINPYKFLNNKK